VDRVFESCRPSPARAQPRKLPCTCPNKAVIGDVEFGEKGEWKKARLMTVQFQNITGTSIDDFRDGKGEVVLWPEQYKAGDPILPYSSVKH
jgi:branched-chain amino acid transport system substrate-binding protein